MWERGKRTDLYLSTLRSYVEGLGGKLSLVVEFPDRPPVILAGLSESGPSRPAKPAQENGKATPRSRAKTRRAA